MTLEAILAYLHFLAILTMVVFLSSEAALCRIEWMNDAVIERLVRVDLIYLISVLLVLATGVARSWWGIKGAVWYWTNPLLYVKLALFVVTGLISIAPALRFRRWRRIMRAGGAAPSDQDVRATRRLVMVEAHLIVLIPLAAVFFARGFG